MTFTTTVALVGEIGVLVGGIIRVIVSIRKITDGTRGQLRSEMLRIYYHNCDGEKIRQYELENFIMLYEAYKALKGNSFIDKISCEVLSWEVVT